MRIQNSMLRWTSHALLISMAILELTACGPARMKKVGTPPEERARTTQQRTSSDSSQHSQPPAGEPASISQAGAGTGTDKDKDKDKDKEQQNGSNSDNTGQRGPGLSGSGGTPGGQGSVNSDGRRERPVRPAVLDAQEAGSSPTCSGQDCNRPNIIQDDGRILTELPLRFNPRTHKLGILFVMDTSASMRDEHQAIAKEITQFVSQLSQDVSFKIGVLLGHGPRSQAGVKVGQLYSGKGRSAVIQGDNKDPQSAARVQAELTERLTGLPTDRSEAQGEVGLLNLYTAFTNTDRVRELKSAGFLDKDTALLIVTVADENDICFDYEEASKATGAPVVGSYSTEKDQKLEKAAFERGDTCRSVAAGKRLTPEITYKAIKAAKGDLPVIVTGIHYLEGQVPERSDQFSKDNEPGRGYLQLISAAQGLAIDLAQESFAKHLTKIGDYSNFHMKYENSFLVPDQIDLRRLDLNSISVSIVNSQGVRVEIKPEQVRVKTRPATQQIELIIDYQALDAAYKLNQIDSGSVLEVRYGYGAQ